MSEKMTTMCVTLNILSWQQCRNGRQ